MKERRDLPHPAPSPSFKPPKRPSFRRKVLRFGNEVPPLRRSRHEGLNKNSRNSDGDEDDLEVAGSASHQASVQAESKKATGTSDALNWRCGMCLLSIFLLWSTTLSLAQRIISTTTTVPSFAAVYSTCQFAHDEVMEQRRRYEECAENQLAVCRKTKDYQLEQEVASMKAAQFQNEEVLERMKHFNKICSLRVEYVVSELKEWYKAAPIDYNQSCSENVQQYVRGLVGGRSSEASRSTLDLSNDYVLRSKETVSNLVEYTSALNNYNKEYVQNKTTLIRDDFFSQISALSAEHVRILNTTIQSVVEDADNLINCISLKSTPGASCNFSSSISALYNNMQTQIEYNRLRVLTSINDVESYVDAYGRLVERSIENADAFYDSISGAAGAMKWVNRNLVSLSPTPVSLCSVTSAPSWCSFDPSSWYIPPLLMPTVSSLLSVPSSDEIWLQVQREVNISRIKSTNKLHGIVNEGRALQSSMLSMLSSSSLNIHDYDPPRYNKENNTDVVANDFESESDEYLSQIAENVANLSSVDDNVGPLSSALNSSSSSISDRMSNSVSQYAFSFQSIRFFEDVDILAAWEYFDGLNSLLILFDTLFRLFQTMRLLRRYWDKTAVIRPIVDTRKNCEITKQSSGSYIYSFLAFFGHMWLALCLLLLLIVLMIYFLVVLYLPALADYKAACVEQHHEESFLSSNLRAVSFNYASDVGQSAILRGLSDYNADSSQKCSSLMGEASRSYDSSIQEALNTANQQNNVAYDASSITTCLNLTSSRHSALNFSIIIEGSRLPRSCDVSMLKSFDEIAEADFIQPDGMFNCSAAFPRCALTCKAPPLDILQATSKECSCMSEWMTHSSVLNIIAVFVVYMLLNISRYLLCKALVMLNWKRLTSTPYVEFWGSLTPDNISEMKTSTSCQMSMEDIYTASQDNYVGPNHNEMFMSPFYSSTSNIDIKREVRRSIRSFRFRGYIYLLIAFVVHVPWVLFLICVSTRLEYSP